MLGHRRAPNSEVNSETAIWSHTGAVASFDADHRSHKEFLIACAQGFGFGVSPHKRRRTTKAPCEEG
jgi:hypothetical protein